MGGISQHDILMQNLAFICEIIQSIAVFLGAVMFVAMLSKLKKIGENRGQQNSMISPVLMLIASAALLAIPSILRFALNAFWGTDSPLAYPTDNSDLSQMMEPVLGFVRVLGVVAFMRGCIMFGKHGSEQAQQGHLAKATTHLIGGLLCMHVVGTSYLFLNLLGLHS